MDDLEPNKIQSIVEGALLSAAAFYPGAASIATAYSEYRNYKQAENVYEVISLCFKNLAGMQANKLDKEFIHSDEFKVLIERVAIVAENEIRKEKRQILSAFLANSCTANLSQDKEKDMILDTIDKLSPDHAALLKVITESLVFNWGKKNVLLGSDYNPDDPKKPIFGYVIENEIIQAFGDKANPRIVESTLVYMESIGVIETQGARGWTTVGGKTGIKGYRPTSLGIKVLEYLDIPVKEMKEGKIQPV